MDGADFSCTDHEEIIDQEFISPEFSDGADVQVVGDHAPDRASVDVTGLRQDGGTHLTASNSSNGKKMSRDSIMSEKKVASLINAQFDAKFEELKQLFSITSSANVVKQTPAHARGNVDQNIQNGGNRRVGTLLAGSAQLCRKKTAAAVGFSPYSNTMRPPGSSLGGNPVIALDTPEDMGSLAGSPSRNWRNERFAGHNSEGIRLTSPPRSQNRQVSFDVEDDVSSVVSDSSVHNNERDLFVLNEEQEIPQTWPKLLELTRNVLNIMPSAEESELANDSTKSVLAKSFKTTLPKKEKGIVLPTDALVRDSWESLFPSKPSLGSSRSVKIASFKKRHREQYRWSDEDYERFGRVPEVDGAVTTYIASGRNSRGSHVPRTLFTEEAVADSTLREIDASLRTTHRVVSHSSYFLASLTSVLSEQGIVPESPAGLLLSGLAASICDITDLSVRASAKCVKARRDIHLKAMNLPDAQAKAELSKVSALGGKLFGGKVESITHASSELVRDIRETAKNYSVFYRPKDSHAQQNPVFKRKTDDSDRPAAKRFRGGYARGGISQPQWQNRQGAHQRQSQGPTTTGSLVRPFQRSFKSRSDFRRESEKAFRN